MTAAPRTCTLCAADALRRNTSLAVIRNRRLTLVGPQDLVQGGKGLIAQVPIFVPGTAPAADFGVPAVTNDTCAGLCYDYSRGAKWWGFATVVMNITSLLMGNQSRCAPGLAAGGGIEGA